MSNTLDEIFDKLNGSSSHACYCQRSTDGGCQCALKDEYLIEAKQQIQALITEARIDELRKLYPQMELGYAGGSTVLRATKVDDRLTQLKEKE